MTNLWNRDFLPVDAKPADMIIQEQCDELFRITNGIIIGRVSRYDDAIHSYEVEGSFSQLAKVMTFGLNETFDIQDQLGELSGKELFTFEFYLTSKSTPDYKYRAFFIRYGLSIFPVEMVIDDDIAKEIRTDYNIICTDVVAFTKTLGEILNSDKIHDVITALLTVNKRQSG